jgi:hypothetical protein
VVFLTGLILTLFCFGLGTYKRWHARLELDGAYLSKLAWVSVGLGGGTGFVALPALWVLVSHSIHGGTIESNLPPGANASFLLVLLVIGTLITLVYAFVGYRDHVYPSHGAGNPTHGVPDIRPTQMKPDDLP